MNTQQVLSLAFQHLNSGNLQAADQLFEDVLQREQQNFSALNGRGFIALQQNRLAQSAEDFQRSLQVNARQAFAQKMLGVVLGAMGHFEASMNAFAAALVLDAKDPEVYFNRANFKFQAGKIGEALSDLDCALKLRPSYLEARSNRANLLIQIGEFVRAEKDLDYLVSKVTNNPDLWVAQGLVRYRLGKLREAMQSNERALNLVPSHPDALLNSASTAFEAKDYEASLTWANKGIAVAPDRPDMFYAKANALAAMSRFDESITVYDQVLQIQPQYAEALNARGLAKASLRRLDEAISDYDQAIRLQPDYHDAIYNKSYAQLEHGDFVGGWSGYERRFQVSALGIKRLPNLSVWDGQTLGGALLVYGEQGLGDQMLFASVVPDLLRKMNNVYLCVEPRLVELFQRSFPELRVISSKGPVPKDVLAQVALGSLPQYFRRSVSDFDKANFPYLCADAGRTADFRALLGCGVQKIIGLSWRSFNNRFTSHKSMRLAELAPLFGLPNTTLVDLQYGDTKEEIDSAKAEGLCLNQSVQIDQTQDIDGLASLIDACDVIVTVSNTTAHIAGALGKPVLLMLPHQIGKLWYWSECQGKSSLWYPSVKSFHQTSPDSWQGTINEVVNYLKD